MFHLSHSFELLSILFGFFFSSIIFMPFLSHNNIFHIKNSFSFIMIKNQYNPLHFSLQFFFVLYKKIPFTLHQRFLIIKCQLIDQHFIFGTIFELLYTFFMMMRVINSQDINIYLFFFERCIAVMWKLKLTFFILHISSYDAINYH